ncbi:hypothetical protein Q7P37_003325 [Cladosporium fusiforme]
MDIAGNVILETASLHARSGVGGSSAEDRPAIYKVVGIILAVCSGLFIGVSFVVKKIGLLKANVKYNEEAGEGYGYLKNAWWWTGMTLMIVGEICNFAAYMFVDAILVTPLGALSVVVTTILSAIFLKERLSFVGKMSCVLAILGSVIIVLNAPEQSAVSDIQQMQDFVIAPGFLSYTGVVILGCAFTAFWAGPRYGKKTMLVYLTICSMIGGLSVVATQGLGAAIIAQINGKSQFKNWFIYVLIVFVISTLLTEIIYLNKALNLFNAALVTPTYYVYFTSATIIASAVLFQGFKGTPTSISTVVMGFLVICVGVILLQLAKSSKDVPEAEVFKGEFDQVRTIAEQEEPEYEPRADTIRGGGAIVRALSRTRTKRQAEEAHRIHEERMMPIGENETVEWDGLKRRATTSTAPGSIRRSNTVHPPLGMTHVPQDDDSEPEDDMHPGFFARLGRRMTTAAGHRIRSGHSPVPMASVDVHPKGPHDDGAGDHDTAYHSPGGPHLRWAGQEPTEPDRTPSRASSSNPPRPPLHVQPEAESDGKRQFSFHNVFNRSRPGTAVDDEHRPISRGALSFVGGSRKANVTTEEERLGLVHGDSSKNVSRYSQVPEGRESDEWQITSGASSSPEMVGASGDLGHGNSTNRGRRDPFDDYNDDEYDMPPQVPRDHERDGSSGSGGAFV